MGDRRSPGDGSVYQRGDGKWVAQVEAGYTSSGKRRRIRRVRDTKTAAREALADLIRDRHRLGGLPAELRSQTVAAFLADWLTSVEGTVTVNTLKDYRNNVDRHIVPVVGKVKLARLSPPDVQRVLKKASAKGLAPKTVRNIRQTLHTALNQAMRWQLVERNVAAVVPPPQVQRPDITPLTLPQARRLLNHLEGDRLKALWTVAIAVGCRLGEALGLRWKDVDLEERILYLRKQLRREGEAGARHYVLRDLKSKKQRTVPLPAFAAAELAAHRKLQAAEQLQAGPDWVDGCCDECGATGWGLVFTTHSHRTSGRPLHPSTAYHAFQDACEGAGVPQVRVHDLRHTAATLLLAQGVPLSEVQEILGHSSIQVTKDVYGHLEVEHLRDAADRMDGMFGSGKG